MQNLDSSSSSSTNSSESSDNESGSETVNVVEGLPAASNLLNPLAVLPGQTIADVQEKLRE